MCLLCLLVVTYDESFVPFNHCMFCYQGTLKENAEQIGHAVKHVGLRPSLPIMMQAVSIYFHQALPKRLDPCSNMLANCCLCWPLVLWCSMIHDINTLQARYSDKGTCQSCHEACVCLFSCCQVPLLKRCLWVFLNCLAALVLLSLISCGLRRPHTPRDKRILQIFELGGLDVPGVG